MKLGIILFLFLILTSWLASSQFCSVMCGTCTGVSKTSCSTCRNSNWILTGSSCSPNNATGYYMGASTPDIGEGASMVVNPWGILAVTCSPFNSYGSYQNEVVRVRLLGGITQSFFQLTAYFGIIAIDAGSGGASWNSDTFYIVTMTSGTFSQINYYKLFSGLAGAGSIAHYCSDGSQK